MALLIIKMLLALLMVILYVLANYVFAKKLLECLSKSGAKNEPQAAAELSD